MFFGDCNDTKQAGPNRRRFLKILALTGVGSSFDLFGSLNKVGFGKEGEITPDEMRQKAMQLFLKDKPFQ